MGLRDLYYYTWSPESSRTASEGTMNDSGVSAALPDGTHNESYWTWPIPGRRTLCWLLVLFFVVFLALVCSIAFTPSSASTEKPRSTKSNTLTAGHALVIDEPKDKGTTVSHQQALTDISNGTNEILLPKDILEEFNRNPEHGCGAGDALFNCHEPGEAAPKCIPFYLVCNGKIDCPTARDEAACITLSTNASFLSIGAGSMPSMINNQLGEGYVLVRINGVWHPYCSNDWTTGQLKGICDLLGFSTVAHEIRQTLTQFNSEQTNKEITASSLLVLRSADSTEPTKVIHTNEQAVGNFGWSGCEVLFLKCR